MRLFKLPEMMQSIAKPACAVLAIICLLAFSQITVASQPYLAFSDMLSGPDEGLGDGRGTGVVVTVWGQHLGGEDLRLIFEDSSGARHEAYIYYWKRADGKLPSGPADLYSSHKMSEIAFSIPESSQGKGRIFVEVDGQESNSLPFTVREGEIFHVKSAGAAGNEGSWEAPVGSIDQALAIAPAGSTIYVHDVDTGSESTERAVFWNNASASSSLTEQMVITPYPGFQPKIIGQRGFEAYRTDGAVVSKMDVYSSNFTSVSETGQPEGAKIASGSTWGIKASKDGRAVANRIGDIPGMCASRYQGAISGDGYRVSNFRILGNEIYDYGCSGSSKLHHTTYMSIRSDPDNILVDPWEFGYNYLHGNKAKFGIHSFDQNEGCGRASGPVLIHNNVVKDQGGAGISIGASAGCEWSMDFHVENNILINVGLAAAWDGKDPNTSDGSEPGGIAIRDAGLTGTIYVRNNLVYGWSTDGVTKGANGCLAFNGGGDSVSVIWENNICYTDIDVPFFAMGYRAEAKSDNASGRNNVWHYSGSSPKNALVPVWDSNPIVKVPLIRVADGYVYYDAVSPLIGRSTSSSNITEVGAYGVLRDSQPDIGPIEYQSAPPRAPSDINVN